MSENGNPIPSRKGSKNIKTLVKEQLLKTANKNGETYQDLYVRRILNKAISSGDFRTIELIWAYMDGKPKESLDIDLREVAPIYGGMAAKTVQKLWKKEATKS